MVVVSPTSIQRGFYAGTPARSTDPTLFTTARRCRYIAQRAPFLLLQPAPQQTAAVRAPAPEPEPARAAHCELAHRPRLPAQRALVIAGPGRPALPCVRALYLDQSPRLPEAVSQLNEAAVSISARSGRQGPARVLCLCYATIALAQRSPAGYARPSRLTAPAYAGTVTTRRPRPALPQLRPPAPPPPRSSSGGGSSDSDSTAASARAGVVCDCVFCSSRGLRVAPSPPARLTRGLAVRALSLPKGQTTASPLITAPARARPQQPSPHSTAACRARSIGHGDAARRLHRIGGGALATGRREMHRSNAPVHGPGSLAYRQEVRPASAGKNRCACPRTALETALLCQPVQASPSVLALLWTSESAFAARPSIKPALSYLANGAARTDCCS